MYWPPHVFFLFETHKKNREENVAGRSLVFKDARTQREREREKRKCESNWHRHRQAARSILLIHWHRCHHVLRSTTDSFWISTSPMKLTWKWKRDERLPAICSVIPPRDVKLLSTKVRLVFLLTLTIFSRWRIPLRVLECWLSFDLFGDRWCYSGMITSSRPTRCLHICCLISFSRSPSTELEKERRERHEVIFHFYIYRILPCMEAE